MIKVIESLCVVCGRCQGHVQFNAYQDHLTKGCIPSVPQVLPQTLVDDILRQPVSVPLTPLEQKLQTNLARRSLSSCSSEGGVLHMKTGGKVVTDTTNAFITIKQFFTFSH